MINYGLMVLKAQILITEATIRVEKDRLRVVSSIGSDIGKVEQ